MKIPTLRFFLATFFIFNTLIVADLLYIPTNHVSWGWLGYNIFAWLVLEVMQYFSQRKAPFLDLTPLFAWLFIALLFNNINGVFFYTQTFERFDRYAHFILLGILGTLAFYKILKQILNYKKINLNIYLEFVLVFMTMNTLSVLHEICEYGLSLFRLWTVENTTLLQSPMDTQDDLFMVAAGSVLTLVTILITSKHKIKNRV